jgi:XTP/dITP diphosphohydrolase
VRSVREAHARKVHVIVTSPRVAPGLLSAEAWALLTGPARAAAPDLTDPVATAVRRAGVEVTELVGPTVPDTDTDARRGAQPDVDSHSDADSDRDADANADGDRDADANADGDLVWLAPHGETGWARRVAVDVVGGDRSVEVEVVHGSYDLPGARLLDLVHVMDRLRRECPWDRKQTHESLARYLLEEAYETLEAIDADDQDHLREELGDLLLQVMFHARIASEREDAPWDVDDVAGGIVEKLIRRHPHVFSDVEVDDADEVNANWETIKAAEKGRSSAVEGIPLALPALARADKLLARVAQAGLDPAPAADATPAGRIGTTLLDVVREARSAGVDPEQALRATLIGYGEAVRAAERSDH